MIVAFLNFVRGGWNYQLTVNTLNIDFEHARSFASLGDEPTQTVSTAARTLIDDYSEETRIQTEHIGATLRRVARVCKILCYATSALKRRLLNMVCKEQ